MPRSGGEGLESRKSLETLSWVGVREGLELSFNPLEAKGREQPLPA